MTSLKAQVRWLLEDKKATEGNLDRRAHLESQEFQGHLDPEGHRERWVPEDHRVMWDQWVLLDCQGNQVCLKVTLKICEGIRVSLVLQDHQAQQDYLAPQVNQEDLELQAPKGHGEKMGYKGNQEYRDQLDQQDHKVNLEGMV